MARVLIVEDETVLRASMARALAKLPADVVEAGTVSEARAALGRGLPDVIVSDLDLPDGTGIELIGELGRLRARVPVVFVSAYLRAFRAQIPPHADVEVREKPVALDELRALVRERIGGVASGSPPFAVADYLQLACLGKHSVVVEVGGGFIEVVKGEIWHAQDATGTGLPALRRLTFAGGAEVTCRTLVAAPHERSVEGKWEALLLDGARAWDEQQRGGDEPDLEFMLTITGEQAQLQMQAQALVSPPVPAPPPAAPVDAFGDLSDRALDALLAHDYPTAASLFAAAHALRPDDRVVAANLERLAALGYPTTAPEGPPDAGT